MGCYSVLGQWWEPANRHVTRNVYNGKHLELIGIRRVVIEMVTSHWFHPQDRLLLDL